MDLGDWFLEVNGRKVGPFTLDQIQGFLDDGEIRAYHQVTSNEMGGRWISVEELLEAHPGGVDAPPPPPPSDFPEATPMVAAPVEAPAPVAAATGALNRAAQPQPQAATESAYQTEYVPTPEVPSIAEMAATYSPDASFQPPPRPEIDAYVPIDDKTDPAISLFNALQIVRERQAASFHPPVVKVNSARKPLFKVSSAKIEEMTKEVTKKITRIRESIPLPEQIPPRMWLAAALIGIVLGSLTMGVFKLLKPKLHPAPGSLTQVNGLNPGQSANRPVEAPRHALPPPPVSAPRTAPMIVHPGADNFADHPNDRPENNPPPPHDPQQQSQPQPYQDPNNPYPQDANGAPNQQIPPEQQQNAPPPPPQPQFDQNGNPIPQGAPPPGFDPQGNPLPGYAPPQGNPNEPNQVQPGAPGQDAFQPGQPQQ